MDIAAIPKWIENIIDAVPMSLRAYTMSGALGRSGFTPNGL